VPEGVSADGFLVYRRDDEGAEWAQLSPMPLAPCRECSYLDTGAEPGTKYDYMIELLQADGSAERYGPISISLASPSQLTFGVLPNPGSDGAMVTFALPRSADALLRVLDVQGREVARSGWRGCGPKQPWRRRPDP
jgi:hypothetical protein